MTQHRSSRYGAVAQALHWATVIFVLIAFIYGPGGSEERIYAAARDFDRQLHETLGLCVLALVVVPARGSGRSKSDSVCPRVRAAISSTSSTMRSGFGNSGFPTM